MFVLVATHVLNIPRLSIWQTLSYTSYKYVGMVACLLLYLSAGSAAYYATLVYCIFATFFFLLRLLKSSIFESGGSGIGGYHRGDNFNSGDPGRGRKRNLYLLLAIFIFQSMSMWLLTR